MPVKSEYINDVADMLKQLPLGAFLTVKSEDKVNTMTIGWGTVGFMWNRPVLTMMVRYSRYTHELIKNAPDFSVSVPLDGHLKKALAEVGSTSGRDLDKFAAFDITPEAARSINSPVIADCGLIYECRMLYKHPMEPGVLAEPIESKLYRDKDFHVLYYGEIVANYKNRS